MLLFNGLTISQICTKNKHTFLGTKIAYGILNLVTPRITSLIVISMHRIDKTFNKTY